MLVELDYVFHSFDCWEAIMALLDTPNVGEFNLHANNNPSAVLRRKLNAKMDEQIQLVANKKLTFGAV